MSPPQIRVNLTVTVTYDDRSGTGNAVTSLIREMELHHELRVCIMQGGVYDMHEMELHHESIPLT